MKLNEKIKQKRLEIGLTQTQVAEHIGSKRIATISDFEKGKKSLSSKRLEKVLELLKIELS